MSDRIPQRGVVEIRPAHPRRPSRLSRERLLADALARLLDDLAAAQNRYYATVRKAAFEPEEGKS